MTDIFCPMIHGGLNIDLKTNGVLRYNQCCLSTTQYSEIMNNTVDTTLNWNNDILTDSRTKNNEQQWLPGCWQCQSLEKAGNKSFRKSMIEKFGVKENLSGPQRIDLLFDRNCNLACRSCGPESSTMWIKHLKDNNLDTPVLSDTSNLEKIKSILKKLDLSNIGMIQFCGGETLLGNSYWQAAELLAELVPDAKNRLELGFQTNGTQSIDPKYYDLIDKFKLVKLLVSIDGVGEKFEYLRWPASWNQTVDNIFQLRDTLPSNVMFFVQECTSCLNLFYSDEVKNWVKTNFNCNREGDPTDHNTQLAKHEYLNVNNITVEYLNALAGTPISNVIDSNWKENPDGIREFITETEYFDQIRGQDWKKTFPEVAEFYSRYL